MKILFENHKSFKKQKNIIYCSKARDDEKWVRTRTIQSPGKCIISAENTQNGKKMKSNSPYE